MTKRKEPRVWIDQEQLKKHFWKGREQPRKPIPFQTPPPVDQTHSEDEGLEPRRERRKLHAA